MKPASLRGGMTSFEVLCATVLATLLMSSVLGITAGIARHEKRLQEREPKPAWTRQLATRLRADLSSAETIKFFENGFVVAGPLDCDPTSGIATWLPGSIEYRLVEASEEQSGWVLLRVTSQNDLEAGRYHAMAFGVQAIFLGQEVDASPPFSRTEEARPIFETTIQDGPLPKRLLLSVDWGEVDDERLLVSVCRP